MQVRYQTAPRSDTFILVYCDSRGRGFAAWAFMIRRFSSDAVASATEDPHELLELAAYLPHDLLALRHVGARLLAGELVARPADGEALVVEPAADLADDDHVLALVIAPVAAPFHGLELRKFLFPVAQHVRLHAAQLTHLSDGEVALAGNRRQLGVILWLQHRLRPVP